MRAPEADRVRLQHMLEAMHELESRASELTEDNLDRDAMLRFAAVKLIEIIGEAANKLSKELHDAHPEVPWALVIGMRNKLVHDYFHIDTAVVAEVIAVHLIELRQKIEKILADG